MEGGFHEYSLDKTTGKNPTGGLAPNGQGALYGTTSTGGKHGAGTIFQIDRSGYLDVLYNFAGYPDGSYPIGGLTIGLDGRLYGATEDGGTYGMGTIFVVDQQGTETILHNFAGISDGAYPFA